jgi:hypothetical protein
MARYNTIVTSSSISGNTTLSSPSQGVFTTITGASNTTITLPPVSQNAGAALNFYNNTGGNVTLSTGAGPTPYIIGPGSAGTYQLTMPNGAFYALLCDGTNYVLASDEGGPLIATTGSFGSTLGATGDLTINTNKFVVTGTNGNTSIAGTLTLGASSDIAVNTNKFTVQASSGNIGSAGTLTLGASSDIAVNTTKFTVQASSGNIGSAGVLSLSATTGTHSISSSTVSTTTGTGALTIAGGLGVNGQITCTTLVESSSIVFKKTVRPLENPLEAVLKLKGVMYDRKDGSTKDEVGLLAEEVYKILPQLVSLDANGKPYGVQYTKLTAYLIESIKSLKKEINQLKGKK